MDFAKNIIPKTHLYNDGQFDWLMCPRCKNTQVFTVLIQCKVTDGLPNPKSINISAIEDDTQFIDYNTIICEKCFFYLTWGGATWQLPKDREIQKKENAAALEEEILNSLTPEEIQAFIKRKRGEP